MFDESTNTIVDLQSWKEAKGEHLSGKAICSVCAHEWVAVSPVGLTFLECPQCHAQRGMFVAIIERIELEHWKCNCGTFLFFVTKDGMYCPICGDWQRGF